MAERRVFLIPVEADAANLPDPLHHVCERCNVGFEPVVGRIEKARCVRPVGYIELETWAAGPDADVAVGVYRDTSIVSSQSDVLVPVPPSSNSSPAPNPTLSLPTPT